MTRCWLHEFTQAQRVIQSRRNGQRLKVGVGAEALRGCLDSSLASSAVSMRLLSVIGASKRWRSGGTRSYLRALHETTHARREPHNLRRAAPVETGVAASS